MLLLLCMCLCAAAADLSGMRVSDLKAMLKDRGLPLTGLKSELVSRLEGLSAVPSMTSNLPIEEYISIGSSSSVEVSSRGAVAVKGGAIIRRRLLKTAGIAKHSAPEPISVAAVEISLKESRSVLSESRSVPPMHTADEEDELEMLMKAGEKFIQIKGVALPASSSSSTFTSGSASGRERSAAPSAASLPSVKDDVYEQILVMVEDRLTAKMARNYDDADAIKDSLRTMFGVEMSDRAGEWKDRAGRFGTYSALPKAPAAAAVATTLSEREIQQMVEERTSLRRERRYADADVVRDELARNGVVLLDKENEWETTDGRLSGVQSEDRGDRFPRGGGW